MFPLEMFTVNRSSSFGATRITYEISRSQSNNFASRACRDSGSIFPAPIYSEARSRYSLGMTTSPPTVDPGSDKRAKGIRVRGTLLILFGLGILVWPVIAVVSAFMYPTPDGNTLIEVMALIGLPLLGFCLLLIGMGIENLVRARRLSR